MTPSGRFRYRHRCPLSPASFCTRCRSRAITQPALPIAPTGNYVSNFFRVAPEGRRFFCLLCCESRPASVESASCPTWLSSCPQPFLCFAATAAPLCFAHGRGLTQTIPAREASVRFACVSACSGAVPIPEITGDLPGIASVHRHPRPRFPKILPYPVGVNRPGAFRPGTDHASLQSIDCYCLGGRRFGLSAVHRPGAARFSTICRNLSGFTFARLRPRPGERPPGYCQYRLPSGAGTS